VVGVVGMRRFVSDRSPAERLCGLLRRMKFLGSLFVATVRKSETRQNLRAFGRFLLLLLATVVLFAVLFHVIMELEGQSHSWLTGFYWALTVMTTLGFGDITFTSDLGRLFTIVVLLTGVVLLLLVLPFTFIQFFYAPWLEAKLRLRAPRMMPSSTRGHVVIARWDAIAEGLVERLRQYGVPYVVIEPDAVAAARLMDDGVATVTGEIDASATYAGVRLGGARLLVANAEDTTNTNVALTAREISPEVPIVAIASSEESMDVLRLSGCTHPLPLKQWLGRYLANRTDTGRAEAHVVGAFTGLQIAEFALRHTPLAGRRVRDTRLRETTGLSVVGVWERGRLQPAGPDTPLTDDSVMVVAGQPDQIAGLEQLLQSGQPAPHPVLILGCGKVGRAAAQALRASGAPVYAMDREASRVEKLRGVADRLYAGDASDRDDLMAAGLEDASTVLLTTNDDATNIYLAVFCRRLRPDLRIVSRINHRRNLESIHRAGADFVLSYVDLGVDAVLAIVQGQELVILGEGIDLFSVPVPPALANKPLSETGIGARTGLTVVAIEQDGRAEPILSSSVVLRAEQALVMLGSMPQRQAFADAYEGGRPPARA
jgi:voltage-gated potassium channel